MGYETTCRVRVDDGSGVIREAAEAKVLIETDELIVRGAARVKIPRSAITKLALRAGTLTITSPQAVLTLTLGEAAPKWQKKLQEAPKRLIDKLDVKPGDKVWLLGALDAELVTQLEERTDRVARGRAADSCAVVCVSVASARELERIDRALAALSPRGAIWVVHPKGPKGVADTTIFAHAKALGLVATKVARVSDTHSAEKLLRRRA
jgi:hypothetical protein